MTTNVNRIYCYIPDTDLIWKKVLLLSSTSCVAEIQQDDGSVETCALDKVSFWSPHPLPSNVADRSLPLCNIRDNIEDMITLDYLHEPAILYNLKSRFKLSLPYTYTGDICIAMNPYTWLPHLYTEEVQMSYCTLPREELPPHVYAISISAYDTMRLQSINQSILVSGESGAGKTETTKIVMNHLATISGGMLDTTISKIIAVNPLLESFGNAKTVRNDNSSRFGKFTQLQFDDTFKLKGAKCSTYLLEKTRVVCHEEGERNYHIFYQILAASDTEKKTLQLKNQHTYAYTGHDDGVHIDGRSDAEHYTKTKKALELVGLKNDEIVVLMQTLAGILTLGEINISAHATEDEESSLVRTMMVETVASLLGLSVDDMEKAFCNRTMKARADIVSVPLTVTQAEDGKNALAKAMYAHIFDWLVTKINVSLRPHVPTTYHIGVLDIFGFEHFEHNSFEQFCINYANEKLQQKFTQDVFKTVQIEYEEEGIEWAHIAFVDNQDVLTVIESKMGIISLLNEELLRPKGNEESFVSKVATLHKEDNAHVITFPRTSRTQFCVQHYAAPVTYDAIGFLEKHKDALLTDLSDLMRSSSVPFIVSLFPPEETSSGRNRRSGGLSSATVGTQFKLSLSQLMETIQATKVHYVRCIKPNANKSAEEVHHGMVIQQLRCAGVIEAIRISRAAYPNRLSYNEFLDRFYLFITKNATASLSEKSEVFLQKCQMKSPEHYQKGSTKIYFQLGVLEDLEHRKQKFLEARVRLLQRIFRGYIVRLTYTRQRAAIITLQSVIRCVAQRRKYLSTIVAITRTQAAWRGRSGRTLYNEVKRDYNAIVLQRYTRGYLAHRQYEQTRKAITLLKSWIRMKLQRPKYLAALQEKKHEAEHEYQLETLHRRLQSEQNKNAKLEARDSVKIRSHVIADADGALGQLRSNNQTLREEVTRWKASSISSKEALEKTKTEYELHISSAQVKLQQLKAACKEKDKYIDLYKEEYEKMKVHIAKLDKSNVEVPVKKSKNMLYRVLGSKKTAVEDNESSVEENTEKSAQHAETSKFLQASENRMSYVMAESSNLSADGIAIDVPKTAKALTALTAMKGKTLESIKGKMASMKGKYYGEGTGTNASPTPAKSFTITSDSIDNYSRKSISISAVPQTPVFESFNLDSMPEVPLPPGWEARVSRSKGTVYYCNPALGITTWVRPSIESLKEANKKNKESPTITRPPSVVE